nr:immunoglobulin heavy chain junction region [Mus musculus]
CAREAWDFW